MSENEDKMKLAKSAKDMAEDESIPTIESKDEPDVPWSEAKAKMKVAPNFIVIIPPKETDTGIVLPDGTNLMDDDEYRPVAEKVGQVDTDTYKNWFDEGEKLILHPNAAEQAIPIRFMGHRVFWIHRQFVMGTEK